MLGFEDRINGLVWITPEITGIDKKNHHIYLPEDSKELLDITNELNTWKSEGINKFITNSPLLGDELTTCHVKNYNTYYAYDEGGLSAVVVFREDPDINYAKICDYVLHCERCEVDGVAGYLSLAQARDLLLSSLDDNNLLLNYVVVSPGLQGRGIGTRVVRSINDNIANFTSLNHVEYATACIHNDNVASQKIFKRNGYEPLYNVSFGKYSAFDDFYRKMED